MDITRKETIDVRDKNVVVIGIARSGVCAARLANDLRAKVFISDHSETDRIINTVDQLAAIGIKGETGRHSDRIFEADLWVISPGVSKDAEIIQKAKCRDIPIVSEIEFSSWFTTTPILAVTGSNGKTTTVHILNEMCTTNDIHPILSGNVGNPFSDGVRTDLSQPDPKRIHILEISSFQMEFIVHFKPFISLFLNLSPDHLNRYKDYEDYIATKMNMWSNQTENDFLVYNADDELLAKQIAPAKAKKIPFSLKSESNVLFNLNATKIYDQKHAALISLDDIALPGLHNLSNFLGAITSASLLGIASSRIAKIMSSFCGVPHRLENVGEIEGVTYINDSKATNVDAVKVALDSFESQILLILGGRDKGGDFLSLIPHTHNKVKEVLTVGEANDAITAALRDAVRLQYVGSLQSAVEVAHSHAQPGDIVLLSPGCASYDQFDNFEHRGDTFRDLVKLLEVRA